MRYKVSATFFGKCDICKREDLVFKVGEEESKTIVTICQKCVEVYKDNKISEMLEKFGKNDEESFERGIRNLNEKN